MRFCLKVQESRLHQTHHEGILHDENYPPLILQKQPMDESNYSSCFIISWKYSKTHCNMANFSLPVCLVMQQKAKVTALF